MPSYRGKPTIGGGPTTPFIDGKLTLKGPGNLQVNGNEINFNNLPTYIATSDDGGLDSVDSGELYKISAQDLGIAIPSTVTSNLSIVSSDHIYFVLIKQ
jgi:hypothetical protein